VVRGRSYKTEELADSTTALVTLKSIRRGGGYSPHGLKPYTGVFKEDQVVAPGELVVAQTDLTQAADVIGRPAIVPGSRRFDRLVASLDLAVVRPNNGALPRTFLYYLLMTKEFQQHAYGHANGSTVLHLNKEAVPSFKIALPTSAQLAAFDALARPLLDRAQAAREENVALGAVSTALLPKLMKGHVRVSETYRTDGPEE
jgi:type I restriction enzyme, S subunit